MLNVTADSATIFENDSYRVIVGALPGKYDDNNYPGYIIVNKITGVAEGAQSNLPYAKDVANGLHKLLTEEKLPGEPGFIKQLEVG